MCLYPMVRHENFVIVVVDVEATTPVGQDRIGIDLGLATTATCLRKLTRHTPPKLVRIVAFFPTAGRKVSQGLE
ncbi:MAG: hypothetical protein RBR82_01485 [Pseudomonas sp.]|nr:hypothetical protein [Pseudomonas sp.]